MTSQATYETVGHAAAVAAAVSNPVRRHGRAKTKTKLHKPLVTFNRLPDYLRDNEFVVGHYRPGHWTFSQIFYSVFQLHNETFNIWSHLLGFIFFTALTWTIIDHSRRAAAEAAAHHVPRWPMYIFCAGAMTCLFFSATCHLLGCCEPHITTLVWRFDYVGIAALIVASYFPPVYYGFYCQPFWQHIYLWSILVFGAMTIVVSFLEVFQTTAYRYVRPTIFSCLGLLGIVPVLHQCAVHFHVPLFQEALILDLLMGFMYLSGAAIYAARVPERWRPGSFDSAFHSHNIFHLCVVLAAYIHYEAAMVFIRWRTEDSCM